MDAVEVAGLVKRYGKVEALGGVDLRVREGAVFGLVGPNGAGKTTLIKAPVGSLRPTEGSVSVLGLDPLRDRAGLRRRIGYMPQSPALYEDLSARDNIAFFGAAHRIPDLRKRVAEVLEFTDLADRAKDPIHTFSGGMRRRVSLACALVHRPRMLFLDEPTAAVDPQLRSRFWAKFRELADDGVTLFISTHLMDEAVLCDRISILRKGRVIASDSPRGILERGKTRLVMGRDGGEEESFIGGHPEDLAEALRPYGLSEDVTAVNVEADSLESVVLSIIGEADR
ncbi:MAG: ABC transporter ATP-binding protein [Propionibacteriaceae bacterium]|nr:ABC transporter ATP-binding protein [Propionibacteriaceae bacterium]